MVQKIKREYANIFNYAQNNLFLVGILGVFGFPLYYFIWQYIYPQSYESLGLRLVCSALFLPWLFYNKLPLNLVRIFPVYFFFSLFVAIPLFFTYMLFANNFSDVWLMSYLAAIYLAILLLYHWWLIIIMFSFAIAINLIFYPFNDIATTSFGGFDSKYIPIYLFAIVSGMLCHRSERKSQFKIKNMKSFVYKKNSIKCVLTNKRQTFKSMFEYANKHYPDSIVVVANNDIYFDESIKL